MFFCSIGRCTSISSDDLEVRNTANKNHDQDPPALATSKVPLEQSRPSTLHHSVIHPHSDRVMKLYTWRPPFTSVPWLPWREHVVWGHFWGSFAAPSAAKTYRAWEQCFRYYIYIHTISILICTQLILQCFWSPKSLSNRNVKIRYHAEYHPVLHISAWRHPKSFTV